MERLFKSSLRAGGNTTYTSKMAVVELNALGTWWKSLYSNGFIRHPFRIMADEYTDVTTIEELTICCRWVESGVPEEHFIEFYL